MKSEKTGIDYWLTPGNVIDSDNPEVIEYALQITGGKRKSDIDTAIELYYYIRDDIRYNPHVPFYRPEHHRSSHIIKQKKGLCMQKAGLLCAAARASGIPARVGFATVKNHLATKQLLEKMGSDTFSYHGYTELWLNGKWVKATPAFDAAVCSFFKITPLEFDGINDSILQEFNSENSQFMQYCASHGEFHDIPVDMIVKSWRETYGDDKVNGWIREHEARAAERENRRC